MSEHDPDFLDQSSEKENYGDEMLQKVHSTVRREKDEPWEGDRQMPFFLLLFFGMMCSWAGYYMSTYSGNFDSFIYDHNWKAGAVKEDKPKEWIPLVEGEKLYRRNCMQCHQMDGKGVDAVYPPLAGSEWVLETQATPIRILLSGLQGPIEVLGKPYKGNMPNFGEKLSDKKIAAVLTYVRQSFGNQGSEIDEATVTQVREDIANRSQPWSAQELMALPDVTPKAAAPDADTSETDSPTDSLETP